MAYANPNFRTKKALKEAVKAGKRVSVISVGPFDSVKNGVEYLEGPYFPEPHKWCAKVKVKDGFVERILS